jgi:hypothetical protein
MNALTPAPSAGGDNAAMGPNSASPSPQPRSDSYGPARRDARGLFARLFLRGRRRGSRSNLDPRRQIWSSARTTFFQVTRAIPPRHRHPGPPRVGECKLVVALARITSTPLALGHFAVPTPGGGPRVAVVCALAFVLMIPWEISRRNPGRRCGPCGTACRSRAARNARATRPVSAGWFSAPTWNFFRSVCVGPNKSTIGRQEGCPLCRRHSEESRPPSKEVPP